MDERQSERVPLVDVHAHLDGVEDLTPSLQEAKAGGVIGVVAVGMDIESNKKTLKIAEENKGYVFPALGYHPWEIDEKEVEENLSFIQNHIHECVALGEMGWIIKSRSKRSCNIKSLKRCWVLPMNIINQSSFTAGILIAMLSRW